MNSAATEGADVVVVGGGIVGAATAYQLARQGASVVLCEKDDLADGASGRNPGFVWMHTRRPGPQLELARLGRAMYDDLESELDASVDLRRNGGLIFFHTPDQRKVMEEFVQERREAGVDVELLDGDAARSVAPILPEEVLGASYCHEDAQITTAKVVRAYADAAERLGAKILRGAEVLDVRVAAGAVAGVETAAGAIGADRVVLAAGVWSMALARRVGVAVPVRPMRLQVVATEVTSPALDVLLYGPSAIPQYDIFHSLPSYDAAAFEGKSGGDLPFLELACQTADGRFLLGCPMDLLDEPNWTPDVEGVGLTCRSLSGALPALRALAFERAWAGCLPHTADSLPIIDESDDVRGLVVAAGHIFGNAAGPATGRLIAQMVAGEPPAVDLSPFRLGRASLDPGEDGTRW